MNSNFLNIQKPKNFKQMNKNLKKRIILIISQFIFVFVLMSCSKDSQNTSQLYVPDESNVTATATLDELQQGRVLFINNCGACHAYPTPESYTPSQWKSIMNQMGPKTSMSSAEIVLVTKYVCKGQY